MPSAMQFDEFRQADFKTNGIRFLRVNMSRRTRRGVMLFFAFGCVFAIDCVFFTKVRGFLRVIRTRFWGGRRVFELDMDAFDRVRGRFLRTGRMVAAGIVYTYILIMQNRRNYDGALGKKNTLSSTTYLLFITRRPEKGCNRRQFIGFEINGI